LYSKIIIKIFQLLTTELEKKQTGFIKSRVPREKLKQSQKKKAKAIRDGNWNRPKFSACTPYIA